MLDVRQIVTELRARYGPRGALAVASATGVLALVPLPGMTFVPVAVAELIVKARRQRPTLTPIPIGLER